MKTLVPAAFLRVREKFVPTFLFEDTELSRGAGYLYVYLFSRAYHHGICRVSQERLAHVGKCCVRSVQNYLKELVDLQYLDVLRDPNGRSLYRLLRSPRVLGLIREAEQAALEEAFFAPAGTQILPEGGANFAPAIKKKEEIYISPLSPLPEHPTRASSDAARRMPSPPVCKPQGRGEFLSPRSGGENRRLSPVRTDSDAGERQVERTAAEADFERLFAAWPVKKDKRTAERIFHSLRRAGRLPVIGTLLATVERFQREDKHWRNGCPPLLTSWLRGERWHDEPFQPQQVENRVEMPVTALPPRPLPEARPVPLTEAERRGMGEFAAVTSGLRALWPSEGGAIPAALTKAKLRGMSLPGLLTRAQAFVRDAARPVSFGDWMREVWVS